MGTSFLTFFKKILHNGAKGKQQQTVFVCCCAVFGVEGLCRDGIGLKSNRIAARTVCGVKSDLCIIGETLGEFPKWVHLA